MRQPRNAKYAHPPSSTLPFPINVTIKWVNLFPQRKKNNRVGNEHKQKRLLGLQEAKNKTKDAERQKKRAELKKSLDARSQSPAPVAQKPLPQLQGPVVQEGLPTGLVATPQPQQQQEEMLGDNTLSQSQLADNESELPDQQQLAPQRQVIGHLQTEAGEANDQSSQWSHSEDE